MNTSEHREPTSVRLDPDVRERLEAFCRDTRRSRNNAINYLLANALPANALPVNALPATDDLEVQTR